MDIVIIGAGQGGLRAAAAFARKGYKVSVYEKQSEKEIGINWFDGISTRLFSDLDIEIPSDSFKGNAVSFLAPDSDKPLFIWSKPEAMDWSVNRHTFTRQLIADARQSGAELFFETPVESLMFRGAEVCGVCVDGKNISADLVIDSSGMNSPFRSSLPLRAGITAAPDENDVFNVYRGIYAQKPNFAELPENRKFQMFLKYKGRNSISWCGVEPSGELNVLVGMIGSMSNKDFSYLYDRLLEENPIIGEVKEGRCFNAQIPVRYPLARFSYTGYTAIGDAAFMTIPIMGSGIENSLRAADMLVSAVTERNSASPEALWQYQVKYYRSIGALCCLLDWCKRGLLASDNGELKKFMESGAVRDEDIKAIMSGELSGISVKELLSKPKKFYDSRRFFSVLFKAVVKGIKAAAVAFSIPGKYDTVRINQWVIGLEEAMEQS